MNVFVMKRRQWVDICVCVCFYPLPIMVMGGQTWWLVRLDCVFNGWLDLVVLMGWLEMFVKNQFGGGYFLEVEEVFLEVDWVLMYHQYFIGQWCFDLMWLLIKNVDFQEVTIFNWKKNISYKIREYCEKKNCREYDMW